jgi:hypothetical protein
MSFHNLLYIISRPKKLVMVDLSKEANYINRIAPLTTKNVKTKTVHMSIN